PHLTAPPPPIKPPEPVRVMTTSEASTAPSVPQNATQVAGGSRHFPLTPGPQTGGDEPIGPITNIVMDAGPRGMPSLGPAGGPAVTVRHATERGPLKISDLEPGMLLTPIRPVYPPIAKATGTQG